MADNDAKPMTDADIRTPPSNTSFEPAAPLKNAGTEFEPETSGRTGDATTRTDDGTGQTGTARATQAIKDGANKLSGQANDRLRAYALDGQTRAGDALGQVVQMLNDAAGQVDDKLGSQYGDYARQAAGTVNGFADTIRNKDVDELFEDARAFVAKSPAVAVGAAAAVGFVFARLIQSGIEADRVPSSTSNT